ncbi:MAG TPA: DUF2892 domain-containing protein [candidate division Zixibacteria bacterium]|nr:DUF2892 domain-containing protein [candidate division Zixibacteria bacterium]
MTVERALRLMAGTVILGSIALAHFVSAYWYLLTAFVGLNLFQSAFTNWCPAMTIFRKLGLPENASKSNNSVTKAATISR